MEKIIGFVIIGICIYAFTVYPAGMFFQALGIGIGVYIGWGDDNDG